MSAFLFISTISLFVFYSFATWFVLNPVSYRSYYIFFLSAVVKWANKAQRDFKEARENPVLMVSVDNCTAEKETDWQTS